MRLTCAVEMNKSEFAPYIVFREAGTLKTLAALSIEAAQDFKTMQKMFGNVLTDVKNEIINTTKTEIQHQLNDNLTAEEILFVETVLTEGINV